MRKTCSSRLVNGSTKLLCSGSYSLARDECRFHCAGVRTVKSSAAASTAAISSAAETSSGSQARPSRFERRWFIVGQEHHIAFRRSERCGAHAGGDEDIGKSCLRPVCQRRRGGLDNFEALLFGEELNEAVRASEIIGDDADANQAALNSF